MHREEFGKADERIDGMKSPQTGGSYAARSAAQHLHGDPSNEAKPAADFIRKPSFAIRPPSRWACGTSELYKTHIAP